MVVAFLTEHSVGAAAKRALLGVLFAARSRCAPETSA